MTTDFRALCAELTEFVARLTKHYYEPAELLTRARAALADEPAVPEGRKPVAVAGQPSDEELLNFARNQEPWKTWLHPGGCLESAHCEVADLLSAVLARWGNPAPQPVPVSERLPGPKDCDANGYCWRWSSIGGLWVRQSLGRSWYEFETHWLPAHALPVPGQEVEG